MIKLTYMKKKRLLFCGIIITGIIILVIYLRGILIESPIKLPLIIPTPTLKLQIFESQKYNFRIAYPLGWEIKSWDFNETTGLSYIPDGTIKFQLTGTSQKGKFEVLVWQNQAKAPVDQWISWYLRDEIDSEVVPQENNFSLSNIPAREFVHFSQARKKPLQYIFFNLEDNVYELIFERDDITTVLPILENIPEHKVYDQIIESFQLTEAEKAIQAAKEDIVTRTKGVISNIKVLEVTRVDWSDSSLGCEEPGMMYSQVITPGFKIKLQLSDMVFLYHSDLNSRIIFCPKSQ